jgi:hypothetical protein
MRAYGVGVLVAGLVLGACGMQQARVASDAPTLMVGLTQEQVLSCMGQPASKAKEGTTEVWSYPSGDGAVDTMSSSGQGWASGTKPNSQAYCTINIAMAAGRVSKMSYVGPGGEPISSSSQCAYALQSCIK